MPRDHLTNHYEVTVAVQVIERNTYGDAIGEGSIHFTFKSRVTNLGDFGQILQRIQEAIKEDR